MHIHILGICGTFMGGLAALAREAGHRVTGCDAGVYPPMSEQLRSLGIDLIEGYTPDQLASIFAYNTATAITVVPNYFAPGGVAPGVSSGGGFGGSG